MKEAKKVTKKVAKKAVPKKDTLGMAPAVHRNELQKDIDKINHRIDDLIGDFGDILEVHKDKINKICTRVGIPKL